MKPNRPRTTRVQKMAVAVSSMAVCFLSLFLVESGYALTHSVRKLYWTQDSFSAGGIGRANPDGSNPEAVVSGANFAVGLAVDDAGGKIYWSEISPPRIRSAKLDGTDTLNLATSDLGQARGVALDLVNQTVYWTDEALSQIVMSNLDGSAALNVVNGLSQPVGIAVDSTGGKIYWADRGTNKIQRAALDGTGIEDLVTGVSAFAVAIDAAAAKIYWTEPGAGRIRSAGLDGALIQEVLTGITTPHGIALDCNKGHLYWTEFDSGKVRRAGCNGSSPQDLVTGLPTPVGLALQRDTSVPALSWRGGVLLGALLMLPMLWVLKRRSSVCYAAPKASSGNSERGA